VGQRRGGPGFATLAIGGSAAIINPISCSSAGNCSSGGGYIDSLGAYQAYVVTEKDGTWGDAIEAPGSAALNTGGGAQITAIACSADSGCAAGGYYGVGTQFQALVTIWHRCSFPKRLSASRRRTARSALRCDSRRRVARARRRHVQRDGRLGEGLRNRGNLPQGNERRNLCVTATKAGDVTYLAATATTSVVMAAVARPATSPYRSRQQQRALLGGQEPIGRAREEARPGRSITVTGSAKGNAKLAKGRASAVASYLSGKDHTHASVKTVTTSSANTATVVTTKQ